MIVDGSTTPTLLEPALARFWELSAEKLCSIAKNYDQLGPPPVVTVEGRYVGRGWTDWTRGFQHGSALLQFDATGYEPFFEMGRTATLEQMPHHLTDFSVHDHGFNIVSTYGNLWRLMNEGRTVEDAGARLLYEYALRVSGTVQARRWRALDAGQGFIYSFNGPHSLFIDTVRTLRSLALAHLLGHALIDESGRAVSLLERLKQHLAATVRYNIYYGEGRDIYDVRGRVSTRVSFQYGRR